MSFNINVGINISHWLSQSDRRGEERKKRFTIDDVSRIADLGFDHVRIPVDEVQLWDENGDVNSEAFDLLNEGIGWCQKKNLRSIVDMHILRSHYFNDCKLPKLYTEQNELDRFCKLWTDISSQIKTWSTDYVAYEILNEPKAEDARDWNRVSGTVFRTIRSLEQGRTIVLGSNWYCKTETFDELEIPDDKNLILTFHFYDPMLITHHKASWTGVGKYKGKIQYPGYQLDCNRIKWQFWLGIKTKSLIEKENTYFDKNTIQKLLEKPLQVRRKTGCPIYCGEFGCINLTPIPIRNAWYSDIVTAFRENNIPYANWDYRGSFGIYTQDYSLTGISDLLLKKS